MKSDLVTLECRILVTTERALLADPTERDAGPAWLPLSQVELTPTGDPAVYLVDMPEWLAKDKGLI